MQDEAPRLIDHVHPDQILSAIRAALGEQAEITSVRRIDGGHFNTLYDIETQSPERRVVLRIAPSGQTLLRDYERTMMLAEPFIYDLIDRAGVPTAHVVAVDGSRSIIPYDYMIIDYIDAVSMRHPSVPEDVRPQLMREAGGFLAQIHGIKGDRFGWIMPDGQIRGSQSWADVFGELLAEMCALTREAGIFPKSDTDAMLECYQRHRVAFDECREPVLVHNDIWDPNILVRERDGEWRVEAIIDADRALFADREFESALWDEANPDLLAGYGIPLDPSPAAVLRREFYRMQIYMQYAWFYLLLRPTPDFQAHSVRVVNEALGKLRATVPRCFGISRRAEVNGAL